MVIKSLNFFAKLTIYYYIIVIDSVIVGCK